LSLDVAGGGKGRSAGCVFGKRVAVIERAEHPGAVASIRDRSEQDAAGIGAVIFSGLKRATVRHRLPLRII